jgi:hypothetical protein
MKPHTPILDSHFFCAVKVIAQGPRVFMPRVLSFRTKSVFSNEICWFAFLRKNSRMVRKKIINTTKLVCLYLYLHQTRLFSSLSEYSESAILSEILHFLIGKGSFV